MHFSGSPTPRHLATAPRHATTVSFSKHFSNFVHLCHAFLQSRPQSQSSGRVRPKTAPPTTQTSRPKSATSVTSRRLTSRAGSAHSRQRLVCNQDASQDNEEKRKEMKMDHPFRLEKMQKALFHLKSSFNTKFVQQRSHFGARSRDSVAGSRHATERCAEDGEASRSAQRVVPLPVRSLSIHPQQVQVRVTSTLSLLPVSSSSCFGFSHFMVVKKNSGRDVIAPTPLEESLIMSRFPQWKHKWVGGKTRHHKPSLVEKMTYAPHLRFT